MNENQILNINSIKSSFLDFLSYHQNPEKLFTLLYLIYKSDKDNEEIYKAISNKTREIFCIKIFLYEKNIYNKKKEEICIINSLKNKDNILQYYGSFYSIETKKIWMVYEYHEPGSVLDLGHILDRNFTEEEIALIINDILHALINIHQLNIVNRNICCKNILLNNKGNALLSNFEKSFQKLNISNNQFNLEEINNKNKFDEDVKYDILLIGITCIEMFIGIKKVNNNSNNIKFNRKIFISQITNINNIFSTQNNNLFNINKILESSFFSQVSQDFIDFIKKCLELNINKKPSAYELLYHPFITKNINEINKKNFLNLINNNIEKIENNKKEKYEIFNKKKYSFYNSGKSNTKNTLKSGLTSNKDKSSLNISSSLNYYNNNINNNTFDNKSNYVDKLAEFRIEQMKKNEIIEYDKYTGKDLYSNLGDNSEDSFVESLKASAVFGKNQNNNDINNNDINNNDININNNNDDIKERESNLDNLIIKESDDLNLDFKSK